MARLAFLSAIAAALLAPLASTYTPLSNDSLKHIPWPGADFDVNKGTLLAPILIPRVAGTKGNAKVRQHFIDFFSSTLPEWQIALQNSTSPTPLSDGREIPFVNAIMTRDPPGARVGEVSYLTLVAHYDSKVTPEGFIGATDSAAPCAMLMHIARSVDAALTKKWAADADAPKGDQVVLDNLEAKKGVQIIFLDGEEAFKSWTDDDSIYGARALAAEWEDTLNPFYATFRNPLDSIDLFVLLDLLGTAGPQVPSYFKTTHWAYKNMADIEARLLDLGLKKSSPNYKAKQLGFNEELKPEKPFLNERWKNDPDFWLGGLVGDDHTPFLQRGVEILHLIPHPFPWLWHSTNDNGENLHIATVEDWAVLVTAFVAEWMDLEGHMFDANDHTTVEMPFEEPAEPVAEEPSEGPKDRRSSSRIYGKDELSF